MTVTMSGRSLNVVLACCMLTITVVYVYYSRKADSEYRSTLDSIEHIKQGLFEKAPDERPKWTDADWHEQGT